jgi:hypothetical protein
VHADADVALEWVTQLGHDLQDKDYPIEARSLGRTLIRWRHQIAAWHMFHVSNGPTEAVNNLIKRVKRAAFGLTSFQNYPIGSLLYAGKPTGTCWQRSIPADFLGAGYLWCPNVDIWRGQDPKKTLMSGEGPSSAFVGLASATVIEGQQSAKGTSMLQPLTFVWIGVNGILTTV